MPTASVKGGAFNVPAADGKKTERNRYRVTGAIFLLALLIIGLPMLFDGEGAEHMQLEPVRTNVDLQAEVSSPEIRMPDDELVERVEELAESVDDEGYRVDDGTRLGQPRLEDVTEETRVWAVQIGSFADVEKAVALRDRLRGDKYEAFTAQFKRDQQIFTRVAVGPLLAQNHAEQLQAELAGRYATQPRIMAFQE